ncbi:MAG TPA: BON domain-containing protein [Terriglobales bacterium]|nr:BON domain-containing protein [Terriglobales bacterium]
MMKRLVVFCLAVCLALPLAAQSDAKQGERTKLGGTSGQERIQREVHHELVMLPYYSVFDNLQYQVQGNTVTLSGQVSRPTLKSDAQNVVKDVEGVDKVVNNIEVLPNSPSDDRIRRALYNAIYGDTSLSRYAWGAVPPIHIIVKNGNVTLEGVVDKQADKDIAGIRAKGVPGTFKVENNLRVVPSDQQK